MKRDKDENCFLITNNTDHKTADQHFKLLGKKNYPAILYPVKISLKQSRKIFSNVKMFIEYITSRPAKQEMIKDFGRRNMITDGNLKLHKGNK